MDAGTVNNSQFVYKQTFEQDCHQVQQILNRWQILSGDFGQLNLDAIESLVTIKNHQRVITFENANYTRRINRGKSAEGLRTDQFMSPHLSKASHYSDQLILDGVLWLQAEHHSYFEGTGAVKMLTYKKRLDSLKNPACAILVISRIMEVLNTAEAERQLNLNEAAAILHRLDEKDRKICTGLLQGDSTKETADSIGMSSRAVELRRQRILDLLHFERPIEIVKLLVRLEEHGLIDDRFASSLIA